MRYIPFTSGMGNQISAYFARAALSHSMGQSVPFLTLKNSKSVVCRALPDDPFSILRELDLTQTPSLALLLTSPAAWEKNVGTLWTDISEPARQIMSHAILNDSILYEKHVRFPRNEIVIHLRMSDVPFNRYPAYALPKYIFWKDALKECMATEPLQIRLITNSSHHQTKSMTLDAIDVYVKDLQNYLQMLTPMPVLLHTDGEADDDFMRMRVARFLICGTSSFSTMAALTGENEKCILLESFDGAKTWPTNMLAFQRHKYALSHSIVKDYFDTRAVIKQLRDE